MKKLLSVLGSKSNRDNFSFFTLWRVNSLKFRLLFSALVMLVVMMPIIAFTLNNAFAEQLRNAVKNELKAYSYSIFTVAEVENNQLLMPEFLLENQFNVNQSGLYALMNKKSEASELPESLWLSNSLLTLTLPNNLPSPDIGQSSFSEIKIEGSPHLLYSFSVSFSDNEQFFPVTLHLIKDQTDFLTSLNYFKQQLWTWLIVLMVIFIMVQIIWLLWTLKPLAVLTQELENVEQGEKNALEALYPLELQQVTTQLNTLLLTEQSQRKRYRNALSDLAHSLKNPLAVIQSQRQLSASSVEQLTLINQMIEHQLKKAQSAGESSWHLGISVAQVSEKLINTLTKIYQSKQINFTVNIASKAIFKGDEADLMEILGNVLDNACKAAQHNVDMLVQLENKQLTIIIADDGAGIDESQQQAILARGTRADTYQTGHGIGLAIVRDLVVSYQGKLTIDRSTTLKGAAFIISFPV